MISVVIPCYNAAAFLPETIQSVLAQTLLPCEVLVVDDGSSDRSAEVAASFGGIVRVIRQQNAGECAARNRGLEESRGDWVAFLDADDIWEPTKLEKQLEMASRFPETILVHTGYYLFGKGWTSPRQLPDTPPAVQQARYEVETLLIHPLILPSSSMVRRDVKPRFPVGVRQGGDMLFFTELALANQGRFTYVVEPLAGYRMHPSQVTREGDAWVSHFRNRFRWIEQAEPRLGTPRAESLRKLLRQQVIEWLNLARWNRQWKRYQVLKEYAATLDWNSTPPRELTERLYPRFIYTIKDWVDGVFRGCSRPHQPKLDTSTSRWN